MSDTADVIRSSPIDFPTAVGYALHRTMRWLLITFFVGNLVLTTGLGMLAGTYGIDPTVVPALVLVFVGAVLTFGGGLGIVFKVIVDGATVALELQDHESVE